MKPHIILYIVPTSGTGGAETFILHTAEYHNLGAIKPIYIFFHDGPLLNAVRLRGHQVYLAPKPPRLRNMRDSLKTIQWIASIIKLTHSDLVHSTMAYGALYGAIAAQFCNVPHIWYQHGPVTGWIDTLAELLPSKLILVNSIHTLNRQKSLHSSLKKLISKQKTLEIIYPGTDLQLQLSDHDQIETRLNLRKQWGFNQNDFIIGLICRPQKQKGIHLFIEAFQKLVNSSSNSNIYGMIVGGSSHEETLTQYEIKIHTQAIPLNDRIRFIPATSYPIYSILTMDLLVSSSISPEGFGLTLIEAMSMKKAVLAPAEGGPLDIITDGTNGLLYTPRDSSELYKLMEKLFKDSELRYNLGLNAYKTVISRFNVQQTVSKLETVYRGILETS